MNPDSMPNYCSSHRKYKNSCWESRTLVKVVLPRYRIVAQESRYLCGVLLSKQITDINMK